MVLKKTRVMLATILIISTFFVSQANAASPYDGAPNDLKAFETELLKNLVVVKWGFNYGVGFAGTYNISQEAKDKGVNSLIVTTASTMNPENDPYKGCFAKGSDRKIQIVAPQKNFEGSCWDWNNDGTDFGLVATSVTLPTIPLWDSYWPIVDGWIEIAYYVDGFGIVLRPSKVKMINEKMYVLGVEKVSPNLKYGGLAFNSLGNFVGTVSPYGPGTVPSDYLKLNGAPLQCGWENSSATITNCSTRANITQSARTGVWTIDSPSTPATTSSPSPKPTTAAESNEVGDANSAVSDALTSLSEVSDSCKSIVDEIREILGDFEVANPILNKCSLMDDKISEIDSKRAQIYSGSASNKSKVDQLNKLTDQALAQTDNADQTLELLREAQSTFESIATDYAKYKSDFAASAESLANLDNRISGLPKTTQLMIMKNTNYKKLSNAFPADMDLDENISKSLPNVSSISTLVELNKVQDLIAKARAKNVVVFNISATLKAVEKLIPKYVCIKGKTISVTPATGKCAPGSTKTPTS